MKVKVSSNLGLREKTYVRSDSIIVLVNKVRPNNSEGVVVLVEDDGKLAVSRTLIENSSHWNFCKKLAKKSQNKGRHLLLN